MPTEEIFNIVDAEPGALDPLIPWGPNHPGFRGWNYTDYIQSGPNPREVFNSWARFIYQLVSPGQVPASGYRYAMSLGEENDGQLSPIIPSGEYKLGTVVIIYSQTSDQLVNQTYKLIEASQSIFEQFANSPTFLDPDSEVPNYGVIAAVYAWQLTAEQGFLLPWNKIGIWKNSTIVRGSLPRESFIAARDHGAGGSSNNSNGNGNGKKGSLIPWLALAALAAGLLS